jgi:uncharacterized circularly permuted ATP-grasp superfamily protein
MGIEIVASQDLVVKDSCVDATTRKDLEKVDGDLPPY